MESWKNWFQPHILERGRAYFEEDRVSDLERTEDGCTATVKARRNTRWRSCWMETPLRIWFQSS